MGCDIHAVVEVQVHDRWVTVNTLSHHHGRFNDGAFSTPAATERNYRRFAALAGVRGEGPAPRGLPDDISETAQFIVDEWGADGHSHSWLPLEEAARIFAETSRQVKEDEEADAITMHRLKRPSDFYFEVDEDHLKERDYRLVFWFDN